MQIRGNVEQQQHLAEGYKQELEKIGWIIHEEITISNFRKIDNRIEDKTPIAPTFTVKGGAKIDLPDDFNELDIFRCYITDQLVKYITE